MRYLKKSAPYVAGLALAVALFPGTALGAERPADDFDLASAIELVTKDDAASAERDSIAFDEFDSSKFVSNFATSASDGNLDASIVVRSTRAMVAAGSIAEPADDVDGKNGTDAEDGQLTDFVLSYDRSLIEKIGTQEKTGHTICCPSFSCAYADAVMDGTVHSHDYYTCSNCTWTDWGGGGSWNRCVGSDEELLREAYDQISSGKPTVIHVAASYGEHWIALIGYKNATDPDHLKLSNFIALDPWDGAEINAGKSFTLYGDGCEHISDR